MAVPLAVTRAQAKVDKVTSQGVIQARKLSARLRVAATRALRVKRATAFDAHGLLKASLVPQLQSASIQAAVLGIHDARLSRRTIQLSLTASVAALDKLVKPKVLRKIVKHYDAAALNIVKDYSSIVNSKLRATVNDLIKSGATIKEGSSALSDAFDDLGLSPKHDYQLEAIFRTQSQTAFQAARWLEDQNESVQEILWGYEYVTVGDDRVRRSHQALDGMRLPKEHKYWESLWPPNGWNCRCSVIPVFYDDDTTIVPPAPLEDDDDETQYYDDGFGFNPGMVLEAV